MSPLAGFVHEHLGTVEVLARPRPSGATRVVHVRDATGREWFAKRLIVADRWRAESTAYALWAPLPGVLAPYATCDRRRCLLLPRAPGRQPFGRSPLVMHAAGRMLRRLHDSATPTAWKSTWRADSTERVERLLLDLPRRGVAIDAGLIRGHHAELVDLPLADIPTHGDYQPHNWRWRRQRLHVIDFESAALRPAAFDVARLRYAACWHSRAAYRALLEGYGQPLSAVERRFVVTALPWRAVSAIDLGLRNGRKEMVSHGLHVLDRLGRDEVR